MKIILKIYNGDKRHPTKLDPLVEFKGWQIPYNYCSLNPINRLDPDGMSCVSQITKIDGSVESNTLVTSSNAWYVSIDGSNFIWDPSENPKYKPGYYYLGKRNYTITDKNTGNITFLLNDGTYFWSPGLPSIMLIGTMSGHARTMSNPIVQAIHQGQEDFLNYPVTKATVNTLLFVATGGIEGVTALGGIAVRSIGNLKVSIYRVFGGEARAIGNYWSPINPKFYGSQYRNLAGLPNSNTGAFTLKATTPLKNIIPSTIKPASPLDGNFGRLVPELKIFDKGSVVVKDFWVNF